MWRKLMLSLIVGVLTVAIPGDGSVQSQSLPVTLTVLVGVRAPGGAQAAPETGATQPPTVEPVGGVEVRARVPGTSSDAPAATAIADDTGQAILTLAPGPYWVYLPPAGPGPLGATLSVALPDGTLTPAWTEIDLSDGNPATVTLVATQLNP